MIVRNRKTGKEYEITKSDYDVLVQRKVHRGFLIVSDSDNVKTKILVPKEIEEFQNNLKVTKPSKIQTDTTK